jgi:hypothetical protein
VLFNFQNTKMDGEDKCLSDVRSPNYLGYALIFWAKIVDGESFCSSTLESSKQQLYTTNNQINTLLMHKILIFLNIIQYGLRLESVESFVVQLHRLCPQNKSRSLTFRLHESGTINSNPSKVDRVTICMGELCKCQEENADMIMDTLVSIEGLPFQIDDSPCLGACGVGAMVSVEYEDGTYNLVTGLQETLEAVGLSESIDVRGNIMSQDILSPIESESARQDDLGETAQNYLNNIDMNSSTLNSVDNLSEKANETVIATEREDHNVEHGAVKRMREEARESKEEVLNPWLNMAVYLLNKARSKE